jgi:hypothetical protein
MTSNSTSWFRPFFNLDPDGRERTHPHGLVENGIPARVARTIRDLRGEFASRRDLWNCGEIAPAWASCLRARHPRTLITEEGDPGSEGTTSGYYVEGLGIRPHLWVTIGPRELIFDPTAYQFAYGSDVVLGYEKPGIRRDCYRKRGRSA